MDEDVFIVGAIAHIFLPKKTPDSEQPYLDHVEQCILNFTNKSVSNLIEKSKLTELNDVTTMLETWEHLQHHLITSKKEERMFGERFHSYLNSPEVTTIPIYVRKQNSTILIEKSENGPILVETFRAALPSKVVMSNVGDLSMTFPETSDLIQNDSLLKSSAFSKALYQLSTESFGVSTPLVDKRQQTYLDSRDVAEPFLISDWIVGILVPCGGSGVKSSNSVSKKIRDQVTLKPVSMSSSLLPFRRSGMWLSIKVALQLKLLKILEGDQNNSKLIYKLMILRVLTNLCNAYCDTRDKCKLDLDLGAQLLAKIGRRVFKLRKLSTTSKCGAFSMLPMKLEVFRTETLKYVDIVVGNLNHMMEISLAIATDANAQKELIKPFQNGKLYFHSQSQSDLDHEIPLLNAYKEPSPPQQAVGGQLPQTGIVFTNDMKASAGLERFKTVDSILAFVSCLKTDYNLEERIWLHDAEYFMKTSLTSLNSKTIHDMLQKYVIHAQNIYLKDSNPIGISQMILSVLKTVEILDRRLTSRFPLLKDYTSGVPSDVFDCLLLPHKEDMTLLDDILKYFRSRDSLARIKSGIICASPKPNSFSTRYAESNQKMQEVRLHILQETNRRVAQQLSKINQMRQNCFRISSQLIAAGAVCSCRYENQQVKVKKGKKTKTEMQVVRVVHCNKCQLEEKLEKSKTSCSLLEKPLPKEEHLQNAVIFELMIPDEISHFRDCLALLTFGLIGKPAFPVKYSYINLEWARYKNLLSYLPSDIKLLWPRLIRFGSRCLNLAATNSTKNKPNIMTIKDDQLIVENGLQCIYNYSFRNKKQKMKPLQKLQQLCSFQLLSAAKSEPYLDLQEYLESYSHSQNDVIANQSKCHLDLPYSEFLAYGSLRAGYRLQPRNLYRAISCKEVELEQEAVLALILQSIWQLGPSENLFGRDAHFDFGEDEFAQLFLEMLANLMKQNETNYSKPLILMAAVVITVRIMELNERVFEFAYHKALQPFRSLIRTWSRKIEVKLAHEQDTGNLKELTRLLLPIRISSALSYNFSENIHWTKVIRSHEDYIEYLHTVSILNQKDKDSPTSVASLELSGFMNLLLNIGKNVPLKLRLEVDVFTNHQAREALRLFVQEKWDKAKDFTVSPYLAKLNISKDQVPVKHVVLIVFEKSPVDKVRILYDLIEGTFLVDGHPQSQLPSEVIRSTLFQRYFGRNVHLRVQPEANGVMRTVTKFHLKHYEFIWYKGDSLTIKEIAEDGTVLTLLDPGVFSGLFVDNLVKNYGHWLDLNKKMVYFRRLPVQDKDYELPHEYVLVQKAPNSAVWHLLCEKTNDFIFSVNSKGFKKLSEIMSGVEIPENIVVQMNKGSENVTVCLPRFNLRFLVDKVKLLSLEFPGYEITKGADETLVGLENGITLKNEKSGKQMLLVPHGHIKWALEEEEEEEEEDEDGPMIKKTSEEFEDVHHPTMIDLEVLRHPPYFVYEFDPILKRLVANKSERAWLYLAALHAVTSTSLPDDFTQITGTEMAVRILQSGYVWSSKPYDEESLKILEFIKSLSPKRYYYGTKFFRGEQKEEGSMEVIEWLKGLPSMAAFDGFEIIVDKLIEDSERLNVLYYVKKEQVEEDDEEEEEGEVKTSLRLRMRSYFRFKSFYNDAAVVDKKYFNSGYLGMVKDGGQSVQLKHSRNKGFSLDSAIAIAAARSTQVRGTGWKYFKKNNLVHFLSSPIGEVLECSMSLSSVKDLFQMDFRTNWLKIYELARKRKKGATEQCQLDLILGTMAYKKQSLEQVMNLHIISVFPTYFPQAPEISLDGFEPDNDDLDSVIRDVIEGQIDFEEMDEQLGTDVDSFLQSRKSIMSTLVQLIRKSLWPPRGEVDSANIAMIRSLLYHIFVDYNDLVEALEEEWEERNQTEVLLKFAEEVQTKLNQIWDSFSNSPYADDKLKSRSLVGNLNIAELEWKEGIKLEDVLILDGTDAMEMIHKTSQYRFNCNDPNKSDAVRAAVNQMIEMFEQMMEGTISQGNEGGEILFSTGILPRRDPTSLLRKLVGGADGYLKALILNLACSWTSLKKLNRVQCYKANGQTSELEREIATSGCENWSPPEYPEWLLLELELDIMIRPIQVEVARQMLSMPNGGNGVTQLNMGEGKTSVIVPMLCSQMGKRELCRVTVMDSMLNMNYSILKFTVGGLLNKRVYMVPCRRDMEIDGECVEKIGDVYEECLQNGGIVLALPEYRLSFRLLAYDNILKKEMDLGIGLMKVENFLKENARDILDESDELLNVKYQLVYTVGEQLPLDGGDVRWIVCQKLLKIVEEAVKELAKDNPRAVEFSGNNIGESHQFQTFRLTDESLYGKFVEMVADKILLKFVGTAETKKKLKQFLIQDKIKKQKLEEVLDILKENREEMQEFLIYSGYLRRGILTLGLSKRWRVEYGVDNSKAFRKMAVPFRAKDVPAERTEFGHPDLAILLTHLSYYHSGLEDIQLQEVFKLLKEKQGGDSVYRSWISIIPADQVPGYLESLPGLNLKDPFQKQKLFGLLRKHKGVINCWLSSKVFPRESKQFPSKLVMTSWDLCYERQVRPVTGFSGTNDSSILLPPTISQQDLPRLLETNKNMELLLLQKENQMLRKLPVGVGCTEILELMKKDKLMVLIDAGALMLELNNEQVAEKWLEVDGNLEAVLYFSKQGELMVKCRSVRGLTARDIPYELSSFQGRLEKCGVFLDDQHTRGTDLKFPNGVKACLTVGRGMLRSKLIQASMRMRNLGKGQSVMFYLSSEAYDKVKASSLMGGDVTANDLLKWVKDNTKRFNEEGLLYWAIAGRNYAQRLAAEDNLYFPKSFETFDFRREDPRLDGRVEMMANQCLDAEVTSLMKMYGEHVEVDLIVKIVGKWFSSSMNQLKLRNNNCKIPASIRENFERIQRMIVSRCNGEIPNKKHFSGGNLEEEQEKELEMEKEAEIEEEQMKERRRKANARKNVLHGNVKKIVMGEPVRILDGVMRLPDIFRDTTFWQNVQPEGWGKGVYATTDFIRVVEEKYTKTDLFLRPVEYLAKVRREDGGVGLLVLSPFEANELMPVWREQKAKSTLVMFCGRKEEKQDILMDERRLLVPNKMSPGIMTGWNDYSRLRSALLLASGSLYFSSNEEQKAFCGFLSLALQPWSDEEKKGFESGLITKTGFIRREYWVMQGGGSGDASVNVSRFSKDPTGLVKLILMSRHETRSETSHVVRLLNEKDYIQI